MVKCVMCKENEARKIITLDNLYGKSDGQEIYLCEECFEEIKNVIEDRIREDNPKFILW